MAFLSKLGYYARMASGLHALLRTRPPADPDGLIRRQMENRAEHFLELARRVVFSNPANPYAGTPAARGGRRSDAHLAQVLHADPLVTGRGKVLPLHLLGSGPRSADAA